MVEILPWRLEKYDLQVSWTFKTRKDLGAIEKVEKKRRSGINGLSIAYNHFGYHSR